MNEPVFSDSCVERQQKESEEKIVNLSRMYTGYELVYSQFLAEVAHVVERAESGKLDTNDLEYLSAFCLALRRETVLKHRRFQ